MRNWHRLLIIGLGVIGLVAALALITPWGHGSVAANGTVYYVDADAMGANNGSSWADAFFELQPALDATASGDQIWVAAGTYKPTAEHGGAGDRYRSFQMVNDVAIYGGFDPSVGHTEWEDRDWEAHPTILSGDLDGNDGEDFANNEENSYHVFYHPEEYADLDNSAVLDGFTISGGNANGDSSPRYQGGGMFNYGSSPILTNCTFQGNSAGQSGGGMFNYSSSSPALTNCTFDGNWAVTSGAGMFNDSSSPALTNCIFSSNSTDYFGGGMVNRVSSSPTLTNCTFMGNSAGSYGGGMANSLSSTPKLINCSFTGNSASSGGGMYNEGYSQPKLTNCTFSGNSAVNGGGIYNLESSPTLINCILWQDTLDEIASDGPSSTPIITYSDIQGGYEGEGNIDENPLFMDSGAGGFHLHPCSPCIDAGDNDAPDLPDYDFEGDDRIVDGGGNGTATVDMGVDEVAAVGTCFRVYLPLVLRAY